MTIDITGKVAVVDAILDDNGRVDYRVGATYEQQALAVQQAGGIACIIGVREMIDVNRTVVSMRTS